MLRSSCGAVERATAKTMAKLSGTLGNVAAQRGNEESKLKGFKNAGKRADPAAAFKRKKK